MPRLPHNLKDERVVTENRERLKMERDSKWRDTQIERDSKWRVNQIERDSNGEKLKKC